MGYSQTTKEISDEVVILQDIIETLYNGNPANMYAYNQEMYDGTQVYLATGGGYTWRTFKSHVIDVTDMRYILGRMSYKWHYVGGGSPSGSQNGRIIINSDETLSFCLDDATRGIYKEGGMSDEPADNVYIDFYVYMLVNDLTGNQTISYQGRSGGVNIDIYGDEFYCYEQIIN